MDFLIVLILLLAFGAPGWAFILAFAILLMVDH